MLKIIVSSKMRIMGTKQINLKQWSAAKTKGDAKALGYSHAHSHDLKYDIVTIPKVMLLTLELTVICIATFVCYSITEIHTNTSQVFCLNSYMQ